VFSDRLDTGIAMNEAQEGPTNSQRSAKIGSLG
jgi:hypothetical protein